MNRSHSFLAAASGAVLAVSLVSVPPQAGAAPVRVEAHAVQLQAIAATEAAALLSTAGAEEALAEHVTAAAGTPGLLGIAGALVDVATSFVVMTLMAPISIVMSPLYLRLFGPTLPSSSDIGSGCRYVVCFLTSSVVAGPVVGPLTRFTESLQNLWAAVFPPVAAAAASPVVAAASNVQPATETIANAGPDVPNTVVPETQSPRYAAAQTANPWGDLAMGALFLASSVLAPLWYLAAPITLPLSIFVANLILTIGTLGAPPVVAGTALGFAGWLGLPLLLPVAGVAQIAVVVGNLLSPAVAPAAASPAAVRATGEPEQAEQPVRAEAGDTPGRARQSRETLRRPARMPEPAAAVTANPDTVVVDSDADSGTVRSPKLAARDSVRSSGGKAAATAERSSGSGRR